MEKTNKRTNTKQIKIKLLQCAVRVDLPTPQPASGNMTSLTQKQWRFLSQKTFRLSTVLALLPVTDVTEEQDFAFENVFSAMTKPSSATELSNIFVCDTLHILSNFYSNSCQFTMWSEAPKDFDCLSCVNIPVWLIRQNTIKTFGEIETQHHEFLISTLQSRKGTPITRWEGKSLGSQMWCRHDGG